MEKAGKMPHNLDAERAVLGCMLGSPDAMVKAADMLRAADFYSAAHREIFEAMTRLLERSSNVDLLMVCEELERVGMLEAVGSVGYVSDLPRLVPSTAHLDNYIEIVETKSMLRALVETGSAIAGKAMDGAEAAEAIVEEAEKRIFDVSMRRQSDRMRHIKDLVLDTYTRLGDMAKLSGGLSGVPTGFYQLDKMVFGLQPSDLIIVAGRPSMGKTSFAMNIAQFAAVNQRSVAGAQASVRAGRRGHGKGPHRGYRRGRIHAPGDGHVPAGVGRDVHRRHLRHIGRRDAQQMPQA